MEHLQRHQRMHVQCDLGPKQAKETGNIYSTLMCKRLLEVYIRWEQCNIFVSIAESPTPARPFNLPSIFPEVNAGSREGCMV